LKWNSLWVQASFKANLPPVLGLAWPWLALRFKARGRWEVGDGRRGRRGGRPFLPIELLHKSGCERQRPLIHSALYHHHPPLPRRLQPILRDDLPRLMDRRQSQAFGAISTESAHIYPSIIHIIITTQTRNAARFHLVFLWLLLGVYIFSEMEIFSDKNADKTLTKRRPSPPRGWRGRH